MLFLLLEALLQAHPFGLQAIEKDGPEPYRM